MAFLGAPRGRVIVDSRTLWGFTATLTILFFAWFRPSSSDLISSKASPSYNDVHRPLIAPPNRGEIPAILQWYNFTTGAELGVQAGAYAEHTLRVWTSCQKYFLVDVWAAQENYDDIANVDNAQQQKFYEETQNRMQAFGAKPQVLRMKTVEAAQRIPENSLDYIYVDARHDYCGAKEDIVTWWPKLRRGGVMAGHDYLDASAKILKDFNQDWSICADGSRHMGAVKGAVDEFAVEHGLTVAVTYREPDWPSWLVVKP